MLNPDNQHRLAAQLQVDEGFRSAAYADSRGYLTIGYGHLIDARLGGGIKPSIGQYILDDDIADSVAALTPYIWFQIQDEVRQCALINMEFNLGLEGLLHFPHFLAAMHDKNYPAAVTQLEGTPWQSETGVRADRIIELIRTGAWP